MVEVIGIRRAIAVFPLRYKGGDGAMVRLVSILEE